MKSLEKSENKIQETEVRNVIITESTTETEIVVTRSNVTKRLLKDPRPIYIREYRESFKETINAQIAMALTRATEHAERGEHYSVRIAYNVNLP